MRIGNVSRPHFLEIKERNMKSDQVKGKAKEVAGKAQKKTGELTGNKSQQVKGAARQAEGSLQKNVGNAKEGVKDKIDKA
jgi:uncharacterized protein YjbJ (UPF0337 family)